MLSCQNVNFIIDQILGELGFDVQQYTQLLTLLKTTYLIPVSRVRASHGQLAPQEEKGNKNNNNND